jgi:hypothetical protein
MHHVPQCSYGNLTACWLKIKTAGRLEEYHNMLWHFKHVKILLDGT